MIAGLVLAAGRGRRFGGPKLLAELDGRPLLEHVLAAIAGAELDRVVCVLGAGAEEVRRGVPMHGAEAIVCRDWAEGQAASLRTGVEALIGADAIVVVLGDQPLLSAAAVVRVVSARGGGALAIRATYSGVASHPTLIEKPLYARVFELKGDAGARGLFLGAETREVACDELGSADDVDTAADLEALRIKSRGS